MASCEKCWSDAGLLTYGTGESKIKWYEKLLEERKDNPCTPEEQAGMFWDDEKGIDKRIRDKK